MTANNAYNAASAFLTPPAGPNQAIQYNNSGVFGGEAAFTYDCVSNTLSVCNQCFIGSTPGSFTYIRSDNKVGFTSNASYNDMSDYSCFSNLCAFSADIDNLCLHNYLYGNNACACFCCLDAQAIYASGICAGYLLCGYHTCGYDACFNYFCGSCFCGGDFYGCQVCVCCICSCYNIANCFCGGDFLGYYTCLYCGCICNLYSDYQYSYSLNSCCLYVNDCINANLFNGGTHCGNQFCGGCYFGCCTSTDYACANYIYGNCFIGQGIIGITDEFGPLDFVCLCFSAGIFVCRL